MSSQPKNKPFRIVIFPKDIEIITGLTGNTCRAIIRRLRKLLGKTKEQFITIREFCLFYGLDEDYVKEFL